jgi:hypothetical protein
MGCARLLTNKGPFWVAAAVPGFHAIVVTGLYSDGTDDNTFVRINDPWDRNPGNAGRARSLFEHPRPRQPVRAVAATIRQRV